MIGPENGNEESRLLRAIDSTAEKRETPRGLPQLVSPPDHP